MARWLVAIGLVLVMIGLLWPLFSQLGLGRLPGDIVIERGNFHFYFPIVTCILVSAVLWHCHGNANQHELSDKFAKRHAAATAPRHCAVASARKIRNEHREKRWACRVRGDES